MSQVAADPAVGDDDTGPTDDQSSADDLDAGASNRGPRWWANLRGAHPAWWWLWAMVVLWAVVMGRLVWLRHDRFGSFSFDMGIFDQAVWLLSRPGSQLITVRGLTVFGHHAEPALYLLAPFYRLGAGPHFLNLFQVGVMALAAVPVFLVARDRLESAWVALILAAAYLLHPSMQFMAWELFHPEVIAVTPLLFAYWFSRRRRWRWFAACIVLAVAWKEDVALAAAVLGLLVAVRGERRVGLATAGLCLGWFLFTSRVMIPYFSGTEAFYNQFFGDLGGSAPEIARNAIRDPSLVTSRIGAPDAASYYWKMTAPFGLVPLAGPGPLLVGIPQALVNVLSVNDFTRKITFHYAALPLAGLILATVEGIHRLSWGQARARRVLAAFVALTALAGAVAWGPSPIGVEYRKGWWPSGDDSRRAAKEAALALVPDTATVSASYLFVPHLTHRRGIYEFPNPFKPKNWGVRDENYPPPTAADWLAIDRQILGNEDERLFDGLLADEFDVVFDQDEVVVARRR